MALGASQAARFQAYQTRARMGAQLWVRIIMWVIAAWVLLTFYVVWRQTYALYPQLQRAYFWRWAIVGTLARTPLIGSLALRHSVRMDGAWYPVGPVVDWLNSRQMYRLPFTFWFWHYGIRTALLPIAFVALAFVWRGRRLVNTEHLRGLQLLTSRDHNRQLNGGWLARRYRAHPWGGLNARVAGGGMKLGSSVIPQAKECEHALITGSPGSGKSTLIRHMLYQVQERGQAAIVLDPDGEYVSEFFDESRGDVVLNPLDARMPFWSPWQEFRDAAFAMDTQALAASLVRGLVRDATQEFFQRSARTLIRAMFEVIKDRDDLGRFVEFLAQPREKVHAALQGTTAAAIIDPESHDTGVGIVGVAAGAVDGFAHLPRRDQTKRTWSAREWAQNRQGWVFLPATEDARAAIESLQGVWLDSLVRWLMSAEIGSEQVWIFADELAAMGYQAQIKQLATRGRKRGLALVMGFQNVSQLREIYTDNGAITLTSSPTTKVILRVDHFETAQWASNLLGSREVERMNMTQLAGLSSYREGVNLSPHRSIEHLVLPSEIQLLEPLSGYLCVAGHDRTTIRIEERHLEQHHPAFIPRSNTNAVPVAAGKAEPLAGWQLT